MVGAFPDALTALPFWVGDSLLLAVLSWLGVGLEVGGSF